MNFKKFLTDWSNKKESVDYKGDENIFTTLVGSAVIMLILWLFWLFSLGVLKKIFGVLMVLNCIPLINLIYTYDKSINKK